MNAAQPTKPTGCNAHTFEVWQLNSPIVANHDVLHMTFAINEHANLPASLV
jgi:hypothetical protein